jgi:hypothetical protein
MTPRFRINSMLRKFFAHAFFALSQIGNIERWKPDVELCICRAAALHIKNKY